jgi:hypothetical protein
MTQALIVSLLGFVSIAALVFRGVDYARDLLRSAIAWRARKLYGSLYDERYHIEVQGCP